VLPKLCRDSRVDDCSLVHTFVINRRCMNEKSCNIHAPPSFMRPNSSCLIRIALWLNCYSFLHCAMFSPMLCFAKQAKKATNKTLLRFPSPAFSLCTIAEVKLSIRTRLARNMHFLWWRSGKVTGTKPVLLRTKAGVDIVKAPTENAHGV
jgi:hypothetical protein